MNKPIAGLAFCLACFSNLSLSSDLELSTDVRIEASSEPVSIDDMINGWGSSINPGEYAYASGIASVSAQYSQIYLSAERRYYYYYEFTPDTVAWYAEVERGVESQAGRTIELDVKSFDARGVSGGYLFEGQFDGSRWSVLPTFTLYKVGHYQIGSLSGVSASGEGTNASAYLDYYFDEDKILDYQAEEDLRFGYSFSIQGQYQWQDSILIAAKISDLWNRFEFFQASYRQGCINVGEVDESVCDLGGGAASGIDTNTDLEIEISPTLQFSTTYLPDNIQADIYWHEKYYNLTMAKYYDFKGVSLGALVSTKKQAGIDLSYKWFRLKYLADNLRMSKVRDGRIQLSVGYLW